MDWEEVLPSLVSLEFWVYTRLPQKETETYGKKRLSEWGSKQQGSPFPSFLGTPGPRYLWFVGLHAHCRQSLQFLSSN